MEKILEWAIAKNYRGLRPSEKKVADYLLYCDGELEDMTLVELAKKANVSQPTVLRFAKAMGYGGFKELKAAMVKERIRKGMQREDISPLYGFHVGREDLPTDVPAKVIATTIHLMREMLKSMSLKDYIKAIALIQNADNIVVYGVENSLCVVSDLVTKFLYLGLKCYSYNDYYLQHISAVNLNPKDVAIGISFSGTSRNTVDVLRGAKESGASTIVITNFENTAIAQYADVQICTGSGQFLYGDAIFSRATQLAIVDMLYMGVLISDYDRYTGNLDLNGKTIGDPTYEIK
ncbi:MurR/RpiR family transcriptional regulator [Peptoniphilus equinus]|uniref:MurR/RpiR family transcriptional regulator n=1 Tax=Peptoniphilus equinus TaxID=3016343 RepID=A0ABY7QSW7_9FIRM|nr:MurR/RpiR family transcriptional regulator [Peptoniphilus equinus]WBW49896.1 MurR/RpiR family transcriptional regulator [Peptoniphilus equinus]